MADDDVTPEVPGHAEPDVGGGEGVESEIPVGVDGLTDEQIAKAEAAGPADAGGGDDDDGGDGGALDVSALMDDSGDGGDDAGDDAGDEGDAGADDDAGDEGDAGADDDAGDEGDAGADATPDDDVAEPDNSGDDA